ncbi:MAG TPA: TonB-dependent receptor [Gemmatimonadales bacterium]|nr:TonB-dependent receptor [Gemmatimonadales bacterium]
MIRPSRWALLARVAAVFGVAVSFGAGAALAQTGGKIEGTVRDQSGAPIAGAQVFVVGSAFSATTNDQGYYFINNVPAGVMSVRAQFIGYQPSEVRNVRVLAGQTHTVDHTLEQRAIEVEGITVREQLNPIVPRDQVTSIGRVVGDLVDNLPVDNIGTVLRLQPGVVDGRDGLTIRGGRPGESITYIDGVPVRSVSGNTGTVSVGTNAIEEASVVTGAIGAEFGDAQSGVISLVTRAGGSSFSGNLTYSTDEISGETYGAGTHRIEASLGGPLARNLTFFLSATIQGEQSPRRGLGAENVPIYVMNGIDTTVTIALSPGSPTSDSQVVALPAFTRYSQGQRRPDDWSDDFNFDAKLRYSYGTGSAFSVTYHQTRSQDLFWRGNSLYNPMSQRGSRSNSSALIFNWNQNIARSAEQALTLMANFSIQHDEFVSGLVDQTWFNDHRTPFMWFSPSSMQFVWDLDNFPIDDHLIQNIRNNYCLPSAGGLCIPALGRNDLNASAPFRINPYGVSPGASFFPTQGVGVGGLNLNEETRVTGSAQIDWQANRYNRIKIGGEFVSADASVFFAGNLTNQIFMDANRYSPSRMALYAQDRIDLGDVVVDLGLRYDRLDAGVLYPRTPGRVFSDPLRTGDLSRARTAEDTAVANRCAALLAAADSAGWSTCNMFESAPRSALSPSIRVSFPITDRTGFRLSYAHQPQAPDFNLLATGVNADLAFTNTNDVFGRDLDYGKTILFEFGIRHAFNDDLVLDISAYNKDKVSDITARILPIYDPQRNEVQNLNVMTNADFGNVRGVDIRLDRRIGSLFQGSVSYTYQSARSTGSDPFEYLNTLSRQISNVTGDRVPPPQALLTTRNDRTHTIAGSLALNFPNGWRSGTLAGSLLQNTGMFATFRFASGLPYTRIENAGAGSRGPGNGFGLVATGTETLNSSRMPWFRNVDLRVTRGFRLGSRDLTLFADFRNLFNWENLTAIFAETGDVVNEKFAEQTISPVRVTLQQDAGNLWQTRTVNGVTETGANLNCSQWLTGASRGLPDCIMLRRAEARFGNGDGFFSEAEQDRAFREWFNLFQGPHTLRGPGFNMRIGFELNF